jgi:hypothetical protein
MDQFHPGNDDIYSSDDSVESDCFSEIDGSTQVDDSGFTYDAAYESDLTEYSDDNDDDDNDEDEDGDDEEQNDLAQLLADNEHSPEYYIRQIKEFDEVKDTEENYSDGTVIQLDRIEKQWCL